MPKKLTIEECRQVAEKKGGRCLSEVYETYRVKLKWECKEGHVWKSVIAKIKKGDRWCDICSGYNAKNKKKLTIEECRQVAEKKGGKCLSTEYVNNMTEMKWECSKGHQWGAIFTNIKHCNNWCLDCSGSRKYTIEECKEFAEKKGGKCLSIKYKNSEKYLSWECSKGHQWDATFSSIKRNNTWCPKCCTSRSEKVCREIIEELTNEKFPSVRPDFLRHYKTGRNLELDGYCKKLNMAFEYHGHQHYEYCPTLFHKRGMYVFEEQKERDLHKIELCIKNNIKLIIIPYCYNFKDEEKLREFIKNSIYNIYNTEWTK